MADLQIVAGLDVEKSARLIENQIKNELPNKIQNTSLKVAVGLDITKTTEMINQQLSNLQGLTIKNLSVDSSAIQNVQKQIEGIASNDSVKKVENITKSIEKLSQSFENLNGKDIAPIVASMNGKNIDAFKTIQSLEDRFKEFGATVKGTYDDKGQLSKMVVSLTDANNKARQLTFEINEANKKVKEFVYSGASDDDKGVAKQLEKATAKANTLMASLEKINAKYTDINSPKEIKATESIDKLKIKFDEVKASIESVKNSNASNISLMESEAKKLISEYERLAVSLQNAEYMATSLRTKDIGTIQAIAVEDLKKFETQIKNSKVPISELKTELSDLNKVISQPLNKEELTSYLNSFDIAKAKFKTLSEQYKTDNKVIQEQINLFKKAYQEYKNIEIELATLTEGTKSYADAEERLVQKQQEFVNVFNNGHKLLGENMPTSIIMEEASAIDRVTEAEIKKIRARQQDKAESQRIKEQEQALKQYNKTIDDTINKLNKQSNVNVFGKNSNDASVVAVRTTIEGLITKYNQLKATMGEIKTPEQFKKFENELAILDSQFNKTIGYAKDLQKQFTNDNSSVTLTNKIQTLRNQIERFMSNNGKAMNNGYRSQFDTLLNQLNTIANTGDFNKAKAQFQQLTNEINKLGLRGNSVMDSLKQKLTKFASWMGLTMITASVSREIRGMYSDIITLDTALVDLNKTFQGTSAELESVYNSANEIAKELGVTTEQVINQASAWSRLGYSTAETSTEMAKLSSIFASISPNMDIDTATDGLVSVMKAFGKDVDEVETQIMDKINIVGRVIADFKCGYIG